MSRSFRFLKPSSLRDEKLLTYPKTNTNSPLLLPRKKITDNFSNLSNSFSSHGDENKLKINRDTSEKLMRMEGRKRKRAAHHTACWECHRLHRSCDGGRPCRRCVENAKGTSCRSLPRKPYTRRKTGDQWVNQRTLFLSISETTNVSPPIQNPSTPPSTPPATNIFAATPTAKEKKQRLLVDLINQIKQVQAMTQSLHMRQELLSEQLSTIQSQGLSAENSYQLCPYSYFGTESEDQCECADSNYSPSNSASGFFFDEDSIPCYDLNPMTQSYPYVPSSNTQQDMLDLAEISPYPDQDEDLPFAYPLLNDAERFKESLFIPFAIKDATKVILLPSPLTALY